MFVSGAYQKIPKVTTQNNSGAPMNSVSSIVFLLEPHLFLGTDIWINGYHSPNLGNMFKKIKPRIAQNTPKIAHPCSSCQQQQTL